MKRAALLVAAALLAGCAGSAPSPRGVAPNSSEYGSVIRWWNLEPMYATTMHLFIYQMMERCLDTEGDFWGLRWFTAEFIQRSDYARLSGLWISSPRQIVLDRRVANDPVVVSHEELHDLLRSGNLDHEDPRFEECSVKRLVPVGPP